MSDGHSHGLPEHAHALGRAFAIGIALNIGFVVVEVVYGLLSHSTALLADAAHNLSDVLGLALAWGAVALARRVPSRIHTYGLRRSTVLAALANAVLLLAAVGAVAWEAIGRFDDPVTPNGATMMWVAACGVLVNSVSALLFRRSSKSDANVRGAFLHLAADAAVSAGVIVAGAILWQTGWAWIDPATSIAISIVVLLATWGLLRDSLHLALDGVPKHVDLEAVRAYLTTLPGVESVHDLHVWSISTTEAALTAHLVLPWNAEPPEFLAHLEHDLEERFAIVHTTVQLEPAGAFVCSRAREGAV